MLRSTPSPAAHRSTRCSANVPPSTPTDAPVPTCTSASGHSFFFTPCTDFTFPIACPKARTGSCRSMDIITCSPAALRRRSKSSSPTSTRPVRMMRSAARSQLRTRNSRSPRSPTRSADRFARCAAINGCSASATPPINRCASAPNCSIAAPPACIPSSPKKRRCAWIYPTAPGATFSSSAWISPKARGCSMSRSISPSAAAIARPSRRLNLICA